MRLLLMAGLVGVFFVGFAARASSRSTPKEAAPFGAGRSGRPSGDGRSQKEQADLSRSGRDFLEVCSSVGSEGSGVDGKRGRGKPRPYTAPPKNAERGADSEDHGDAARAERDATCLGWVAGFAEGFLVHDELLGVPRRDRLACVPNGESAVEIVGVMKRYLEKNPEKAHRATRYIASLALAGAFPCRGGR